MHKIALPFFMLGIVLATPSLAGGVWADAEVNAAIATLDKSHLKDCARDAGGTFEQSVGQRDLNGDEINELIIYTHVNGASGCVGRVGQEIDLLISDGNGGWKQNFGFDAHSLNFYDRSDSEWPDVEISGPGFCFPIWRYEGGEYGLWKTCENGRLVFAGTASASQAKELPVEVVNTRSMEGGMPYMHNGSVMMVYPERGLIVYDKPRKGISARPGTVLFKGRPWDIATIGDTVLRGQAFVFRKGCAPAGYDVSGKYSEAYAIFQFTLEGPAPIRQKGSCDVVGHDMRSKSSTLKFEAAWD